MIKENNSLTPLEKAFDTEEFKKLGHALIDQIAEHLDRCKSGDPAVINYVTPEEELNFWSNYQIEEPASFFGDLIQRNIHLHNPHFIGHQVAPPAPLTALTGLLSDMLNVGMGVYEMGSAGTAIERVVVKKFCERIGYEVNDADGILTSGGTLANLTALLGARASFKKKHSQSTPYILVSEQAHFCIERAAMTMGMSDCQVIKIPTTTDFRIDINELDKIVSGLYSRGEKIMCIVACACSTATGSYDNLIAIAEICDREKIWMHVDGAHGGAVIFCEKYKYLCSGIERADSVIIDAHKMMLSPALATAVLFKKESDSYASLSIEAAYLFNEEDQWFDLAKRTYETTKYMIGAKLFIMLQYYGEQLIDDFIQKQYDLVREFSQMLRIHEDFEIAHDPMSNILCFRILHPDCNLNVLNSKVRKRMLKKGKFYIVLTTLNKIVYLRVTIMNPQTSKNDLIELINEIRQTKHLLVSQN